jgi:hypothetical protein
VKIAYQPWGKTIIIDYFSKYVELDTIVINNHDRFWKSIYRMILLEPSIKLFQIYYVLSRY